MTSQQWEEVKNRFHEALNQPAETRQSFLVRVCSSDIVRLEVERLVAEHVRASGFLNHPATSPPSAFAWDSSKLPDDFPDTPRFERLHKLGAGSFGVVYKVFDRDRNSVVALKQLQRFNPAQLLRFKREFRSLVDLVHPNLVQLYELFGEHRQWFFTMELVDGVDFHSYVRPAGEPVSWPRMRDALYQLATGVQALHSAGWLHRDLKPSNVLVKEDGSVVILDFGLVKEFDSQSLEQSFALAGTPGYMAPEQVAGGFINEATDWYAVGVMLYRAITNQIPFMGNWMEALERKRREDAPRCRDITPDVPEDLEQACQHLLERDPNSRSKGVSTLLAFEKARTTGMYRPQERFVGRHLELAFLSQRFAALASGNRQLVLIEGRSGIGKTSLVSHFLNDLKHDNPNIVVLRGRCRESESVPYKAIDRIADELVRHLQSLAEPVASALLPRNPELLPLLFPVFGDLGILQDFKARRPPDLDEQRARRRAFLALSELLGRMTDRNPVVIWIDDLQWGDLDSVALLAELVLPANAPALMLILSFRSEEIESSPALRVLLSFQQQLVDVNSWSDIRVKGLSENDGRELLKLLQPAGKPLSAEHSENILRESDGSPLLLSELLRFASRETEGASEGGFAGDIIVSQMIRHRAKTLSATAREMLEALSVAGEPLTRAILHLTVKQTDEDPARATGLLIREHLVRVTGGTDGARFEPFHDQVREATLSWLSPQELRTWHSHLAELFENENKPDPQRLLRHYRGAGNLPATLSAALAAAKTAEAALAFEQAAGFYAEAIETGIAEEAVQASLHRKRAEALANAGRGRESGQSYLEAARWPAHNDVVDMRRLAAEQLMRSGHLDEGAQILKALMRTSGVHMPATPLASLLRMLVLRAFIRLRGLHWREQVETQIPAETLRRLDLLWIGVEAFATGNPIFGTYLQARHMLEALRAGEPFRLARSLAFGAFYESAEGISAYKRGQELMELAAGLACRLDNRYLSALTELSRASLDFNCGFIEPGLRHSHAAAVGLDKCGPRARAWELGTANLLMSWFLGWGGRIHEFSKRLPLMLEESRSRGDVYVEVTLRCYTTGHLVDLAADNPNRAIADTENAIKLWRKTRYDVQHFGAMFACMESHLYAGRVKQARELLLGDWQLIRSSLLFRKSHMLRTVLFYARGRTALGQWLRNPNSRALRIEVEQFAAKLTNLHSPWGEAFSTLLSAGIMAGLSRRSEALLRLERAETIFRQQDLRLVAATVLRRRGELERDKGAQKVEAADAFMKSENILRPDRMTAMILPGDWI